MSKHNHTYREKEFTYKGFNCAINFRNLGFRTGYVEIPKDHALYGVDAMDLDFDVHGGIAWSNEDLPGDPEDKEPSWWIGFDCAHYMDGEDLDTVKKYFADDEESMRLVEAKLDLRRKFPYSYDEHVWTLEEVEEELKRLVDQLIDYKEENNHE